MASDSIVFLIPIVAIVGGIGSGMFHKWLKFKEKEMAHTAALASEKAAQYAAHIERLEQRVRVLERAVTDSGAALAGEIEALRALPDASPHGVPIPDRQKIA